MRISNSTQYALTAWTFSLLIMYTSEPTISLYIKYYKSYTNMITIFIHAILDIVLIRKKMSKVQVWQQKKSLFHATGLIFHNSNDTTQYVISLGYSNWPEHYVLAL